MKDNNLKRYIWNEDGWGYYAKFPSSLKENKYM